MVNPDILIFLDASYPVSTQRRKLDWRLEEYEEQARRLSHARDHANLYLDTDVLTPEQVVEHVLEYIRAYRSDKNGQASQSLV